MLEADIVAAYTTLRAFLAGRDSPNKWTTGERPAGLLERPRVTAAGETVTKGKEWPADPPMNALQRPVATGLHVPAARLGGLKRSL